MMTPQTTDQQIQAALDAYMEAHPVPGGGADRTVMFLKYNYNTNPAPPSNNQFRMDNIDSALVTALYLSEMTSTGLNIDLIAPGMLTGDRVVIQDENDATKWAQYQLTADSINAGTYWTYPVVWETGSGGEFNSSQAHIFCLMKYWGEAPVGELALVP